MRSVHLVSNKRCISRELNRGVCLSENKLEENTRELFSGRDSRGNNVKANTQLDSKRQVVSNDWSNINSNTKYIL